jgi:hypothetical protein
MSPPTTTHTVGALMLHPYPCLFSPTGVVYCLEINYKQAASTATVILQVLKCLRRLREFQNIKTNSEVFKMRSTWAEPHSSLLSNGVVIT